MIMKHLFRSVLAGTLLFAVCPFTVSAQQRNTQGARYAEELTSALTDQVRNLQDENAGLSVKVRELERKVAAFEKDNKELVETVRLLKRQAAAESAARDEQIRKLSEQIVKLASIPAPAPVAVSHPTQKKAAESSPSFTEYEEYEVVQGATLSAIAAAFKVSVADIKKANNLKNDMLRVGQKLKIPVK